MAKYQCVICGHIYNEAEGDIDMGVSPGTKWAAVPETWFCPDCGASKADYILLES